MKVIRTYSNSDLPKIVGVSHHLTPAQHRTDRAVQRFCKEAVTWKFLRHPNVLPLVGVTISEVRLAMISNWMTNGNINDFVTSHPEVDRLSLVCCVSKYFLSSLTVFGILQLVGVTKGLIYIHDRGMVHGDLKGVGL